MRRHPRRGRLRAWLDGELGLPQRLRVGLHVAACPACRTSVAGLREDDARVAAVLALHDPGTDVGGAWERFRLLARRSRSRRVWPRAAALAGLVGAAAVSLAGWMAGRGGRAECGPTSPGEAGVASALTLRDLCCGDYDGGGLDDDGVLTASGADESVAFVVVYEDVDGSGDYSAGDLQRFRSGSSCHQL